MSTASVVVSIGNSDDKLTQAEWSEYVKEVRRAMASRCRQMYGEWYSSGDSPFQNACFCGEFYLDTLKGLREVLTAIRIEHKQESVAFLVGEAKFI